MRLAVCQINPTVGAVALNEKKIFDALSRVAQKQADLAIFPELALCGYPPKDILFRTELMDQIEASLKRIATLSPIPVVLGAPVKREAGMAGKPLWNAAVYCANGQVNVLAKKFLLPNYDVFDENRYFEPALEDEKVSMISIGQISLGVTICEDAWNDPTFWPVQRYTKDPVADVVKRGAHVIVNIAASPFARQKPQLREAMLSHLALHHRVPVIMVGQVGANDQLIFDGSSVAINPHGKTISRLPAFVEDELLVDIQPDLSITPVEPYAATPFEDDMDMLTDAICTGIVDYVHKCGGPGVVLGLSGGVDSALVAVLAARALGREHVTAIRMPSQFSSVHSLEDAEELATHLGITLLTIPIEPMVEEFRKALAEPLKLGHDSASELTDQNLQARARGMVLMAHANRTGSFVLSTGNKSEIAVGYTTLYGDMCGALAPIADLYKTDVWRLAAHLRFKGFGIPERTLTKAPSAELRPNQTDQDSLPPYEELDELLKRYIDREESVEQIVQMTGVDEDELRRVIGMIHRSEYKRRQNAVCLMLTERVFGDSRRWPVAQAFDPFMLSC